MMPSSQLSAIGWLKVAPAVVPAWLSAGERSMERMLPMLPGQGPVGPDSSPVPGDSS
jgi:hypothetical protein